MLAYAMNGADLPMLNGYPVRLVVPGYYGTYWVKHLADITVLDKEFDGFWMQKAYRIPDNDCACTPAGLSLIHIWQTPPPRSRKTRRSGCRRPRCV